MNAEVATLLLWSQGCLLVAALCTSAFPVYYAFSPWHKSLLGKLIMLQAVAFALAMDLTVLGQLLGPGVDSDDLDIWLSIQLAILVLIAIASASLTFMLWKLKHDHKKKLKKETQDEGDEPSDVQSVV